MSEATPQDRMRDHLEALGLPYKKIDVYGSQIVVTALSVDAAKRWTCLLSQFAKVRGTTDSYDEAAANKNTTLRPSRIRVFRVFARV